MQEALLLPSERIMDKPQTTHTPVSYVDAATFQLNQGETPPPPAVIALRVDATGVTSTNGFSAQLRAALSPSKPLVGRHADKPALIYYAMPSPDMWVLPTIEREKAG